MNWNGDDGARVLQLGNRAGKVMAWSDRTRRQSKRAKDFTDILRLVEAHPRLRSRLPAELKQQIEE